MYKVLTLASLFAAVAAVGCANTSGNTAVNCSALGETGNEPSPLWQGTVFTIVMENHSPGADHRQHQRGAVHQPAGVAERDRRRVSRLARAPERAELHLDGRRARTSASSTTTIRRRITSTRRRTSPTRSRPPALTWKTLPGEHGQAVRAGVARPLRREAQPVRVLQRHQRLGRHGSSSRRSAATRTSSTTRSSTAISRSATCRSTCSSRRTWSTTCTTASIAQGDAWLAREVPKISASEASRTAACCS